MNKDALILNEFNLFIEIRNNWFVYMILFLKLIALHKLFDFVCNLWKYFWIVLKPSKTVVKKESQHHSTFIDKFRACNVIDEFYK